MRKFRWYDNISDNTIVASVLVLLVAVAFVLAAKWNTYFYGDWSCMFTHCVRIK